MKKYLFTSLAALGMVMANSQNYVNGPIGLYGPQHSGATSINSGGSILVGNGGNWVFNGYITSADKGGPNAPSAIGRAETITFDGSGSFTANSFAINGYAATTGAQTTSFSLPIGSDVSAYPITVPAGVAVTAAYFSGSGSTQNTTVAGNTANTTEYSPYIDMPSGITAGTYTISYPGFASGTNSSLLSSGNSSANGTSGSTTYSLLSNVSAFSTSAATTTASLPASAATQVYFASSNTVLPVTLVSFAATASGCTATLAWQTATEINSAYYAVEYGTTGSGFIQVAQVASKNSASGAAYTYAYHQLNGGNNYFRLKAVDNDGRFVYGPVVAVTGSGACSAGMAIVVYPNPASNLINIQHLDGGINTVSLFDMNGRKLTQVLATGTTQTINISQYAKGIYTLRIQNASGKISTVRVVKQ